jgi:hypothetical protein
VEKDLDRAGDADVLVLIAELEREVCDAAPVSFRV